MLSPGMLQHQPKPGREVPGFLSFCISEQRLTDTKNPTEGRTCHQPRLCAGPALDSSTSDEKSFCNRTIPSPSPLSTILSRSLL